MKCLIILAVALMGPAIVAVSQTPETIQPKEEDSAAIARKINGARENSLGMIFVPVKGTDVLFCVWETRVEDYQTFVTDTERYWRNPDFDQGRTHPAVLVSWVDANAFCRWLTQKERAEGKIDKNHEYRLPKDAEWSVAVGGESSEQP
jgi:formylglycine-generating enzyme required for sulfatase activity